MNGNIYNPEVRGLDGVINVYKNSIGRVSLFGPTRFSGIMQQVINFCQVKSFEQSQYNQKYNILLILTDGAISEIDQQDTINKIVEASGLPLSIIIVGIGEADFDEMEKLDADKHPLKHSKTGIYQSRDIVQFVGINDYAGDQFKLAREVLKEIPKQMVSYFQS